MAPENNWLSFSLSSMEMLNSSPQAPLELLPFENSSAASHHLYSFSSADNYYANGWYNNQKPQAAVMYSEPENLPVKENNSGFISYMDSYMHHNMQPPPKLEDFFGGDSTETQDSSLTHIYDHRQTSGAAAYNFGSNEHQELKTLTGFHAFPANSGSEVDDSTFDGQTPSPVESGPELVACPITTTSTTTTTTNALSLFVNNNKTNTVPSENGANKAVVSVDSEGSKRITDTFGQRTSIYRGVTRHRWTGRYEAHLWDNSCRREGQARKGRQVYLGGYDKEERAARAYDLAALKYWGVSATTNFPIASYAKEVEEMKHVTKQEFIASLRRKSSGFSRGASIYRGVTRHHQQGRWQARIGRVAGNKDLYLGTFATEEEAAEAYDIAAIKFRGANAVTNFEMNRYDVEAIAKSPLPIGGAAKRLKLSLEAKEESPTAANLEIQSNSKNSINFATLQQPASTIPYGVPFDVNFFHHLYPANTGGSAASASSSVSTMVTPMPLMPPAPEFFIWPHHHGQSY